MERRVGGSLCRARQACSWCIEHAYLCSGVSEVDRSSCATASMPLSGVRISWLMFARNMFLAPLGSAVMWPLPPPLPPPRRRCFSCGQERVICAKEPSDSRGCRWTSHERLCRSCSLCHDSSAGAAGPICMDMI